MNTLESNEEKESTEKFNCQYCNKPFSTKSNLKTHQKNTKKCIELRKELLNEFPSSPSVSSNSSIDNVSHSTLSNIETEMRYLVDSNLNLLSQIVELNKQIRSVSLRINQIDTKYQTIISQLVINSEIVNEN